MAYRYSLSTLGMQAESMPHVHVCACTTFIR